MLTGASGGASAGGLFDFFTGGGNDAVQSAPLPQPSYAQPEDRPLTVRQHPRHRLQHRAASGSGGKSGRYNVADLKGISMYTDRTLSRGDAVMTADGIKVFNGSTSWPYTDDDFVAISLSSKIPKVLRTELTAIDIASRPALAPQ